MDGEDLVSNRRGALGPSQAKALHSIKARYGLAGYAPGPAAAEVRALQETLEKDLAEGRVLALDGDIVFQGTKISEALTRKEATPAEDRAKLLAACLSAYMATVRGRAPSPLLPELNLLPGPYRLYIAPHSNYVVGVELKERAEEYTKRLRPIVRSAQKLTDESLAANQRGGMTEAQREALRKAADNSFVYLLLAGFLFCVGVTFRNLAIALDKGHGYFTGPVILSALLALGILVWFPFVLVARRKVRDDIAEGRVTMREGPISKITLHQRRSLTLTLRLGDLDFNVSENPALFAAIIEGQNCRAYVTPRAGLLVALELA